MTSPRGPSGLTQQTAAKTDNPSDLRTGVVSAVTSRGIEVQVAGGVIAAAHLDSYGPAVGDSVALMKAQDSWLALGRVVGSGTPTDYTSGGSAAGPTVLDAFYTGGSSTLASSTGATVTVPKFSLTFYHPKNHVVALMWHFGWQSTVTTDWILINMVETVSGLTVGFLDEPIVSTFNRGTDGLGLLGTQFGGAKRNVVMTMSRLAGTGTTSVTEGTPPGYMIALDVGDGSVFRKV